MHNRLDIKFIPNNPFVQFQIWDFPGDFHFRGALLWLFFAVFLAFCLFVGW